MWTGAEVGGLASRYNAGERMSGAKHKGGVVLRAGTDAGIFREVSAEGCSMLWLPMRYVQQSTGFVRHRQFLNRATQFLNRAKRYAAAAISSRAMPPERRKL